MSVLVPNNTKPLIDCVLESNYKRSAINYIEHAVKHNKIISEDSFVGKNSLQLALFDSIRDIIYRDLYFEYNEKNPERFNKYRIIDLSCTNIYKDTLDIDMFVEVIQTPAYIQAFHIHTNTEEIYNRLHMYRVSRSNSTVYKINFDNLKSYTLYNFRRAKYSSAIGFEQYNKKNYNQPEEHNKYEEKDESDLGKAVGNMVNAFKNTPMKAFHDNDIDIVANPKKYLNL